MRLPESAGQEQYFGDSQARSHRNQHCPRMVVPPLADKYSGFMIHLDGTRPSRDTGTL